MGKTLAIHNKAMAEKLYKQMQKYYYGAVLQQDKNGGYIIAYAYAKPKTKLKK